jgi:hypothetical protein
MHNKFSRELAIEIRDVNQRPVFVIWREGCRRIFTEERKVIPNATWEMMKEYKEWIPG